MQLDVATASRFAALALDNISREYPHKLDHVMAGDEDVVAPRLLHPAFHGSFDWHSCVHMHWLLACIRRRFDALPACGAIDALFDRHFTPDAIAAEVAYLAQPASVSFERPYGWAWLLKLATELRALQPLADAITARYLNYLPRARYPVRHGVHSNSAFALSFALDYARAAGDTKLAEACTGKAHAWYAEDRDAPARWEPSGVDFLSPVLVEAGLICRVFDHDAFASWLTGFLPLFTAAEPACLFVPVDVDDRSDPQLVHLDGLNLSRAWCFSAIAAALPRLDARVPVARRAAAAHLAAGWQGLDSGDFGGAHWLASFAMLALEQ